MMSPHQSVESTLIRSVAHDPDKNILEIKFNSGDTYHYLGVSESDHLNLMAASSTGRHFNQNILGRFEHVKQ